MPPVGFALAAGVNGAFISGGAAIGLSAGASLTAAGIFGKLATGVALTALSRAMAGKPQSAKVNSGIKITAGTGETAAQSMIVGRYATAGDLVWHGSWGADGDDPHANYVQVFELSDWPGVKLRRVWVNGEWIELVADSAAPENGLAVSKYFFKNDHRLWIKFYDGTQTVADPELVRRFPVPYVNPWLPTAVGRGIAYAVVTANFRTEVHSQRPECLFELTGIPFYDPRRDSTVGGSGTQRLNSPSTWTATDNPAVMIYNILLGIKDPITGAFVWGGQDITQFDLPAATWFSAMNECDREIDGKPQYRAGLEIRLDEEPASVIEELLKACQGQIAEVGGLWTIRAGPPTLPVYSFSDDDVVITEPETFTPFPGLDEAWNGVRAIHPSPEDGWQPKDAPARDSALYLAADGGRRNTADVSYLSVWDDAQVQRLMKSMLEGARRFRRLTFVLPPEARRLSLLDVVARTSVMHGFTAKDLDIVGIKDLPDGNVAVAVIEVDPADYNWESGDFKPVNPGFTIKPPRVPQIADFAVEPASILDADGVSRRAAIRLLWSQVSAVEAIRYRVRLAATRDHIPGNSQASTPDSGSTSDSFTLNGEPALLNGEPLTYAVFTNVDEGRALITDGILPNTAYEVQAIYVPVKGREWSNWLAVTTPNILLGEVDFEQAVRDKIADGALKAAQAAADALAALNKANEVSALLDGLADGAIQELLDAVADIQALDLNALLETRKIGLAGQRGRSWVRDPSFFEWAAGLPTRWTLSNSGSVFSRFTGESTYGSALQITAPVAATAISVMATSSEATQMINADPTSEYVTVGLLGYFRGSASLQGRLRPEWFINDAWVRGRLFDVDAAIGDLASQWGFINHPTRRQSLERVWKKPTGIATAVRLVFFARTSATIAVDMQIDFLGMREATAAEISAINAAAYADAAVEELENVILGPEGSLVVLERRINARFGDAFEGTVYDSVTALADADGVFTQRIGRLEAIKSSGLVRNPIFTDGVRAPGVAPNWWSAWSAGMSVVARNPFGSSNAIRTAPTEFVAMTGALGITEDGEAFSGVPISVGEKINFRYSYAAFNAVAGESPLQARVTFFSATGEAIITLSRTLTSISSAWQRTPVQLFEAPAGSATASGRIRRLAGSPFTVFYTEVKADVVDAAALAEVTNLEQAIVGPTGSIAVAINGVNAKFGEGFTGTVQQAIIAQTDATSSLAGRMTTVEAVRQYGLVKNPSFVDGARALGVTPDWWYSWGSDMSVVAKAGSGLSAIVSAPTAFIARIEASTTQQQAKAFENIEVEEGDRINFRFKCAGSGTGINFQMQARVGWRDKDGNLIGGTTDARTITVTSVVWQTTSFADFIAPAGAVLAEGYIRRVVGGSAHIGFFTAVEAYNADRSAAARITNVESTKVDADGAIAAFKTEVAAEFGSYSAWTTQSATAFANNERAASSIVFRAVAGGGSAGFRLVAWDDEDGVGGTFVVDARYFIAPGTLSAGEAVFQNLGFNIVPDNQLQSITAWPAADAPLFQLFPDSPSASATSAGEIRYIGSGGTGDVSVTSRLFAIRGGQRLTASYSVNKGDAGRYRVTAFVIFYGADTSTILDAQQIGAEVDTSSTSLFTREEVMVAPSGARKAVFRFRVYRADTTCQPRFYLPSVIVTEKGSILITPNSITGSELITTEALLTNSAQIGNLVVGSINIKRGSVVRLGWQFIEEIELTPGAGWVTMASVVLNRRADTTAFMFFSLAWDNAPADGARMRFRIRRGPTVVVKTFGFERDDEEGETTKIYADPADVAGTYTYYLQLGAENDFGTTTYKDISFYVQEIATGVASEDDD